MLLASNVAFCQTTSVWTSFYNSDSTLVGFKDEQGKITIEPKFSIFFSANTFHDIMAVTEEQDGKYLSYYLTKSGKIVGRDSMHIYDNGFDCESEGFIRFRDKKSDKVGMFNRNGEICIPAIYDELSRVQNGMVVGLKGAEKKYWDKQRHSGCNHYSWVGGENVLIDTNNQVLIRPFSIATSLNLFSIEKSEDLNPDTTRQSFLATDGSYYSFIDFEKEFMQWISADLLQNIDEDKLLNASYDSIIWSTTTGWAKTAKTNFIPNNFEVLKNGFLELQKPSCEYSLFVEGLNMYEYEGEEFAKYFTSCGEAKEWIYPTINVVISHEEPKSFSQNHYTFLRTDAGYKLISVSVRNAELR